MWAQALLERGILDSLSAGVTAFQDWAVESVRTGRIVWVVAAAAVVFLLYRIVRHL